MGAELARARAGKKTKTSMSEDKLSDFASKSMIVSLIKKAIDGYVEKHEHTFPCGHEKGSEIGKACTQNMCGAVGASGTIGRSGTVYQAPTTNWGSAPGGGSMGIHATSQPGSGGGSTGPSAASFATYGPQEGGFNRSADPVTLINRYLDKQSRAKCKHKKGDPSHLEAA